MSNLLVSVDKSDTMRLYNKLQMNNTKVIRYVCISLPHIVFLKSLTVTFQAIQKLPVVLKVLEL